MGRTDNFFPPMAKAADADPDACSAAAADAEAEAEAIEEASEAIVAAACDPAFDETDATTVGTAVPETVEVPMTDAPATSPEEVVPTLDETAESDTVLVDDVTEFVEEDVDVDDAEVGDEGDEEVVATSTDDDVAEDEEEGVADDVSPPDAELEEELLPSEPLFCGFAFMVIEHFLTSSTAGLPLLSVIGVRVTTHVSVIAPAAVSAVCTVKTVVD